MKLPNMDTTGKAHIHIKTPATVVEGELLLIVFCTKVNTCAIKAKQQHSLKGNLDGVLLLIFYSKTIAKNCTTSHRLKIQVKIFLKE